MLHAHALQLIREKQIEDDELLKERTKQITTLNDTEVSAEAANKYGLIRPADFEKPAHEKRIGDSIEIKKSLGQIYRFQIEQEVQM